jgi:hypothetical protein
VGRNKRPVGRNIASMCDIQDRSDSLYYHRGMVGLSAVVSCREE